MPINVEAFQSLRTELDAAGVTLVAVSKTKPVQDILALYELGQRDFGENYVQELVEKQPQLPADIRWHFIGHLQSNKVKYIAPFVHLIHGVDSEKLLREVARQGQKLGRTIDVLLQIHISDEETKFGIERKEFRSITQVLQRADAPDGVKVKGLMGMASFTDNTEQVKREFQELESLFAAHKHLLFGKVELKILSMGMSSDYRIAIEAGSNLVRIGSLLFGARN